LRLPVDRSFIMQGFGTVVTGTVFAGVVKPEDEVQLYPGGQTLRVRGVQVHGKASRQASAGQRAALNVTGADHEKIRRGITVGPRSVLAVNTVFDCTLDLLASAKPLKNRAPVHFHAGTAEVQAQVRTLDGRAVVEPGSSALVRVVLREPLLLLPGDRYIVRMFSPVTTIGGGEVVDCDPPRRMRRDGLLRRAGVLASSTLAERIRVLLAEAPEGLPVSAIVARTGAKASAIPGDIPRFGDWLIDGAALQSKLASFCRMLAEFHKANPLLPGASKEELRSRTFGSVPAAVFDAILAGSKEIAVAGEYVRLAGHRISLQTDEREASARMESAFESAGLTVPSASEVVKASGIDPVRSRTLMTILLRDKRLIRVAEDLMFHASAIDGLKAGLVMRRGQRFSVADFKEWTGVSRKYAIPLLEWLDAQRITRRDGDSRVVL
jgi:selenocysteine-specific elongation factor